MSQAKNLKIQIKKKHNLEDWQVELINFFMLPKALRPHRDVIMAKIGLTQAQYYTWLRHPKIIAARREMVKAYYHDDIPDVLMSMKNEAIAGNERAARLFLEYVDDFKKDNPDLDPPTRLPKKEVNIIINKLEQKFYGERSRQNKCVEGQTGS